MSAPEIKVIGTDMGERITHWSDHIKGKTISMTVHFKNKKYTVRSFGDVDCPPQEFDKKEDALKFHTEKMEEMRKFLESGPDAVADFLKGIE